MRSQGIKGENSSTPICPRDETHKHRIWLSDNFFFKKMTIEFRVWCVLKDLVVCLHQMRAVYSWMLQTMKAGLDLTIYCPYVKFNLPLLFCNKISFVYKISMHKNISRFFN